MIPANVGIVQTCNPRPDHGQECYTATYRFTPKRKPCRTTYHPDGSGTVNLVLRDGTRICLILKPKIPS